MQLTIKPEIVAALKAKDDTLARVIEALPVPVRRANPDLFSAIVGSIISQQISTKAAETIYRRLEETLGAVTPDNLAALDVSEIQRLGMSFRKAGYLNGIAQAVAGGELNLDELSSLPDERVIEELIRLPGIGRWTAEMLLIFSLGRDDVLSLGDLGIRRGIERIYGADCLNQKSLRRLKEKLSPYGTAAGLYFWYVAGLDASGLEEFAYFLGR